MPKPMPILILTLALWWGWADAATTGDAPTVLTVREAIRLAVGNNLDLRAELYNPAQFESDINRAKAIYDPTLSAETVYTDAITPSALLAGPDENSFESWQLNSSLSRLFPSGATAALGFNNSYINDDAPIMLADYWRSSLGISISQPLLKDFGRENTEAGITLAHLAKSASLEKLERRLLALIA